MRERHFKRFLCTAFIAASLIVASPSVVLAGKGGGGKPGDGGTGDGKSWTHPASFTDHISPVASDGTAWVHAANPDTAVDGNGDAIVVWAQDGKLFKSEFRNGAWTHPDSLDDSIASGGNSAKVAMNDNGDAIIVFTASLGINKIEYQNGSWSAPEVISPIGAGAYSPQVAMGNNGDAVIVWQQSDVASENLWQVFKAEYRNGVWTTPSDLQDNISPEAGYGYVKEPAVAIDDNGNTVIAWTITNCTTCVGTLFMSEYRDGVWTHPTDKLDTINDGTVPTYYSTTYSPQVAMDGAGNAVIVWAQLEQGSQPFIYKSEYRNGVWAHPSDRSDSMTTDRRKWFNSPRIAMADNGDAMMVSVKYYETDYAIAKREYRDAAWQAPRSSSGDISLGGFQTYHIRAAMSNNGDAVIVWRQSDGIGQSGVASHVFMSEYRNGSWDHPSNVSDFISPVGTDSFGWSPTVAMGNDGDSVIAWTQFGSDGRKHVFISQYR
jgi:hypothetical protein